MDELAREYYDTDDPEIFELVGGRDGVLKAPRSRSAVSYPQYIHPEYP